MGKILLFMLLLTQPAFGSDLIDISLNTLIGKPLCHLSLISLEGSATIEEIENTSSFQPVQSAVIRIDKFDPEMVTKRKPFWIKISFKNPYLEPRTIFLDTSMYVPKSIQIFNNSLLQHEYLQGTPRINSIFKTELAADQITTFYLRVTPALDLGFTLLYWHDLGKPTTRILGVDKTFSIVMGIIGMSMLFNFMTLITYRERSHLFYLAYLFSFLFWTFSVKNASVTPWGSNDGIGLGGGMMAIFAMLFTYDFLNLSRLRWAKFIIKGITGLLAIGITVCLFEPLMGFNFLQNISLFAVIYTLIYGLFVTLRYRESHAIIFCLAYGTLITGVSLNILLNLGILNNEVFNTGILYGATFENILMIIAIGQKLLATERERIHSYDQLKKMIFPHQLKQIQEGKDLEVTMPVGEATCCVIAFDVVGSSKADPAAFAEKWEIFMSECRPIMTELYNGDALESRAYMIKEMGDGFLCSVGFPFKDPTNSMCESSVNLGLRLANLFNEVLNSDPSRPKMFCSLGIVKGMVKGYFSQSGAIRHDLWGRSIILATRYEGIRKTYFRDEILEGNITTLHYSVYIELPERLKAEFNLVDLSGQDFKIRDDAESRFFAYRLEHN